MCYKFDDATTQQIHNKFGINVIHVPVKNYYPPSISQIEQIMELIETSNDDKILIHCYAGLGRTGTVVACYFVKKEGLPAEEAIKKIREIRFGSIETEGQEQVVYEYWKSLFSSPI